MELPSSRVAQLFRLLGLASPPGAPGRPRDVLGAAIALIAALACLLFAASLRDVPERAWAPPPVTAPMQVERGEGQLEVHVLSGEDGAALPGAVVRVFRVDAAGVVWFAGEAWSRRGEPLGFEGLPTGELWVIGYAQGRARASARVLLGDASKARVVTLSLGVASTLAVHVIDDAGAPVDGASVEVQAGDALTWVDGTDDAGAVRFDRLGPAPMSVKASADGFDSVVKSGVYPSADPLEIRLERLGGFAIHVEDVDGQPAAFAEVLVAGPGLWPARSAVTDVEGNVTVLGLYAGVFDLRARLGDHVSYTDFSVPLPHGKVVERTIKLVEGRYVTVRVSDGPRRADGLDPPPVGGADVVVVEEGLSAFPSEARTADDGRAIVGPLSPGPVTVTARADGFVPGFASGDSMTDEIVDVPLLKGGAIVGDVRDERGFPVEGATIEVIGTDAIGMPIHEVSDRSSFRDDLFALGLEGPTPLLPRGELGVMPGPIPAIPHAGAPADDDARPRGDPWVTRSDGTFRAAPVPPGRVQVVVAHPEFTETLSDVVSLGPGGEIELHLVLRRGGRLEGRVLEEDRTPIVGARLEVAALEGTFSRVTYSTDDGTFAVAALPSEVLVTVYRPDSSGEVAARLELEIEPDKKREIEIVLPKVRPAATLQFVDERDFPLSRVEVRVQSLDLDTVLARTFFSDEQGEVEVPAVRGLPLRLVAERPGRAPLVELVAEAAQTQRFKLGPALTLTGFVTGRGGRIKVEEADVTAYTLAGARHAKTDEDGGFSLEDLGPGRIRLVTRHDGYADDERVIDFEGDARRPIAIDTIDLVEAGSVEGVVVDEDEQPIAGARVGRDAVPTWLPIGKLPRGLVVTDADGRFTLGGLPEGTVRLEAYSPELGRGRVDDVEVKADRVTRRVTVVIPQQSYDPKKIRAAGSLAITLVERNGGVVVLDVPEGGEAEAAGIEPLDALLAIDARPVRTLEEARDRLSGPLSRDVVVDLRRAGLRGELSLKLRVRRETVRR